MKVIEQFAIAESRTTGDCPVLRSEPHGASRGCPARTRRSTSPSVTPSAGSSHLDVRADAAPHRLAHEIVLSPSFAFSLHRTFLGGDAVYRGDVQGVGFRATAAWIARRHPTVREWVRNLADGRVELLADGPEQAVAPYLSDVCDRMATHIMAEDITDRESDDAIVGFHIVG
jgi:acylphosphatase